MEINSGSDVIRIAEAKGFQVVLLPGTPPTPCLRGDPDNASPALIAALKAFRHEIIEELQERIKP